MRAPTIRHEGVNSRKSHHCGTKGDLQQLPQRVHERMDAVVAKFLAEELRCACRDGDIDVVRACLDRGADINLKRGSYCDDKTPLFVACQYDHLEVVEFLLARGALHQITGLSLLTPLHVACTSGHSRIVRRLLQVDTNVNCDGSGTTPITVAASLGHVDVVRALLEHGADPNRVDDAGYTALLYMSDRAIGSWGEDYSRRFVEIARMLLSHGAEFDVRPLHGLMALRHYWGNPWRLPRYDSLSDDQKEIWFSTMATALQRVRRRRDPAMNELFDSYLFPYFLLRIRLYVVGPCVPRPAPRRRGLFGRLVARRPDVGGARYGLVDEPHLARHVASFLVG